MMHVASEEKCAGWGEREMTEMSNSAKNSIKTTENVKNYYCKGIKLFFVAPPIP